MSGHLNRWCKNLRSVTATSAATAAIARAEREIVIAGIGVIVGLVQKAASGPVPIDVAIVPIGLIVPLEQLIQAAVVTGVAHLGPHLVPHPKCRSVPSPSASALVKHVGPKCSLRFPRNNVPLPNSPFRACRLSGSV
jgi:hypothetical protein